MAIESNEDLEKTNSSNEDVVGSAKKDYDAKNTASTDLLKSTVKNNKDHYDGGGGLNTAFRDVGQEIPNNIYEDIKILNKIENKKPEDKRKISDLYARLEDWKGARIADKASVKMIVDAVSSDLVNYELMHPQNKALVAQVVSKDGDFNEKGIKLFNRDSDDKLMVQYTTDRLEKEQAYNQKMEGVVSDTAKEGVAEATSEVVSFEQLASSIHMKKIDAENSIYETVTGQANEATLMNKNSKTFQISSWDEGINSGKSKVTKALTSVIMNKEGVVPDLATRDIFGKGTTYREDLSGLVDKMDLSKMGLVDKGKPGYEDDLAGNALLKEEIIGRLINPKSSEDKKFAQENLIEYFTLLAGQSFNNKRNEITAEKGTEIKSTTSGMTAKEIIEKFS
tara:strand:- start:512 stop:1693 length:1182 start_codon:yes stop_codon:yes gene_type:complete